MGHRHITYPPTAITNPTIIIHITAVKIFPLLQQSMLLYYLLKLLHKIYTRKHLLLHVQI